MRGKGMLSDDGSNNNQTKLTFRVTVAQRAELKSLLAKRGVTIQDELGKYVQKLLEEAKSSPSK